MNTQLPILNVANLQNAARPATQADSFSAEVPFNQVLNKEVSNRNNDTQSQPKEAVKDTSPEPTKAATPTPAASSTDTTKTASSDSKQDDDKSKDQDDSDDASAAASSAQMLALVANLGQIAVQPVAKKTTDQDMDVLSGQKSAKKITPQLGADTKTDLADVQADDKSKGSGKGLDFAALQATDKETPDSKLDAPVRTTTEKALPESPVSTKSALGDLQDAANAARTAKAATPEVLPKAIETPVQPNAATVVPTALQQAMSLNQQAALAGQAVQRLTPAVGSQGWDQAVGQKVLWMANGGLQSASLTLNPPDLGPLQVVLHVNNQQADATFITAQPEVKQALEAAMPKLREMMDQAGIQLGQATVNTGNPNQQQSANQQQARNNGGSSNFGRVGNDDADVNVAIVPRPVATGGQGLVDTFA